MSKRASITVAGAGVLGLAAAVRLAQSGADVTLCDPSLRDNASQVAAGMLAPAFESLLDPQSEAAPDWLRTARDLWPALLNDIGAAPGLLDRSGAVLVAMAGETGHLAEAARRLGRLGFEAERVDRQALLGMQPGLSPEVGEGLYTSEDWRLPPGPILDALRAALERAGGTVTPQALSWTGTRFTLEGRPIAGPVVLALGAESPAMAEAAPELCRLSPIKGQILAFEAPPLAGPVVRGAGGYVVPQASGAVAGATMEAGLSDRLLEPAVLDGLRQAAARLFPALSAAAATGRAGVRATTPDGLPLIGRSRSEAGGEVFLCTGARRNGWLLAPLAAALIVQHLSGERPTTSAFDPDRFG